MLKLINKTTVFFQTLDMTKHALAPLFITASALLAVFVSVSSYAAGDDSTAPPPTTPTQRCADGQIHDAKSGKCVPVKSSVLSDSDRYQAVRELAYAERYLAAELVLDAMTRQQDDRVLTYRGFLMRKTGRFDQAVRFYKSAIDLNPNNLLVRSYLGQGYVVSSQLNEARQQHEEIMARGGHGTWAEISLRTALSSGQTFRY